MYAQQHYSQHLGNSNTVTIAEEGCLLTAICNGLERLNGSAPDPVSLNQFFISTGAYSWDNIDQAADNLSWDSITRYDPTIVLTGTGAGSVPPSNNAIVKFHYNGVHTGQPLDHYCWVDHIEGNDVYIIDSWDGLVKGPSGYQNVYHLPVTWGTYVKNNPAPPTPPPDKYQVVEEYPNGKQVQLNKQPTNLWGMNYDFNYMKDHPVEVHNQGEIWTVTNRVRHQDGYDYYRRDGEIDGFNILDCDDYTPPPPPPPAAPLPIPTDTSPYTVVKTILGFTTSNNAANHTNASTTVPEGTYYIFNRRYSPTKTDQLIALNVTKTPGKAGSWINPDDNVPDPVPEAPKPVVSDWSQPPTPPPAPTPPTDTVPVTVAPNWRESYKPFKQPVLYIATRDFALHDIEQTRSAATVHEDDKIWMAGTFEKDGKLYARPVEAIRGKDKAGNPVERRWYYGEPVDSGNIELASHWDTQTTLEERKVLHRLTTADYINQYKLEVENALVKVWDIFIAPFNKKK